MPYLYLVQLLVCGPITILVVPAMVGSSFRASVSIFSIVCSETSGLKLNAPVCPNIPFGAVEREACCAPTRTTKIAKAEQLKDKHFITASKGCHATFKCLPS